MTQDTQSRKHIITINNPDKKGYSHDTIKLKLAAFKSLVYYCMADEIGLKEHTPHTHIFVATSSPVRHSTMIKRFPNADIRASLGTCEENRAYVEKSGKWADDEKTDTKIDGTFEEWGEMPQEQQGQRTDWDIAYEMLADGHNVMDVIRELKHMMRYRTTLEQTRQELIAEEYRTTFRQLDVTYISGATSFGKTRYVMEKYGYENVCQITGYQHGCFDKYRGEDVLLLDEYASSFRIQDVNNYLDGYPLTLPCRYANKVACYTKVYIISNISLAFQYPNVKTENSAVWNAFIRRIHRVMVFYDYGKFDTYTTANYLNPPPNPKLDTWKEITDDNGDLPFD